MVSRNSGICSYPHANMIQNIPGILEYLNKICQDKKFDGDGIKKNIEEMSGETGQQENGKHLNFIDSYDHNIYFINTADLSI